MQFHIPQYIDIEDKLIGPLTLKQGLFIGGGIGAIYLIFRLIPYLFISGPIIIGIAVFTATLAFYPKERLGKPFIEILEAGFKYMIGSKLYTWKKTTKEPILGGEQMFIGSQIPLAPTLPSGKLSSTVSVLNTVVNTPKIGEVEKNQQYVAPIIPSIKPTAPTINIIVDKSGGFKIKK